MSHNNDKNDKRVKLRINLNGTAEIKTYFEVHKCVSKCPELDCDNTEHCMKNFTNEDEMKEFECPCGNKPSWKLVYE